MKPSAFFVSQLDRLREASRLGPVVDLACGRGRQALAAAADGLPTLGIDRDAGRLRELGDEARRRGLRVATLRADLETGPGLPLRPGSCGAVLVFRYLHRPLAPAIVEALAPGGLLVYETFTIHQRDRPQGPSNPAFLLHEGELAQLFAALLPLVSWEGDAEGFALARLAARRPAAP